MKYPCLKTILLCLCLLASINAFAEAVEINGIYYNLFTKIKEAEVTSNPGKYTGAIKIPETITYNDITYSVTSIGWTAFRDCSGLTSVTIPNSVTSIRREAFSGCSGLTSIEVESGNRTYDSRNNCNAIIETTTNTLIQGCKNTTIPNSVTSIGESAFYDCSGLTSVTIPNSVTSIGRRAFAGCSGLTSITIPNSVTSIGREAFCECVDLTSITIPNSVTSIGEEAFCACSVLTTINVEAGNTVYDSRNNCNAIIETATNTLIQGCNNTTIPNSVTSIGGCAFYGCSGLTSVTIPNSVTNIGEYAFCECVGLTSVTIPNSVTSIGVEAFTVCFGLTTINVEAGNTVYDSRNNCNAIIETATNTLIIGCKNTTIPNSVTSIGEYAFCECVGLTSVTIPNSVTSIGEGAFYGCSSLTSITIPNSVTSIGDYAFQSCSGLTSVNIGNGVESIGYEAFADCAELTDVYCYAEKVPSTQSRTFADSYTEYATLHVPAASVEQYKTTAPWSNFGTIVATDGTIPEPPTPEKCATPTISYSKGELTFSCDTEGAEFISEITDADIKKHYTASVSLTATYNISVYATKAGYENSDTIQATLCWIEQQPQTEGITDEDAIAEVQAVPVLIQTQGNTINVQGAEAGTEIILYGTNGVQLDSVIATTGTASLNASGLSGSVAIVKIGNKTVKMLIKQ